MNTPICDFVRAYRESESLRLHMPGHKGRPLLGPEPLDITEIPGADVLYHARGVIRESEENAASLFGSARTLYSAEGSSLCIRAMLQLSLLYARLRGLPPRIAAGRNAHRVFLEGAALLDQNKIIVLTEKDDVNTNCDIFTEIEYTNIYNSRQFCRWFRRFVFNSFTINGWENCLDQYNRFF